MAFVPPIHKKVPDMVKANTLALGFALLSVVVSQSWAQEFDPGGLTLMKVKPLAERAQEPEDIAVAVWPSGVIDAENTHYLTQNNLTVVEIAIANPKARKIASSRMICDLPADVMLDAVNTNLVWNTRTREKIDREGQTYVRYSIEMRPSRYTIPDGKLGTLGTPAINRRVFGCEPSWRRDPRLAKSTSLSRMSTTTKERQNRAQNRPLTLLFFQS